ncbi:MAG TPA: PAS domain S-box protein [Caulobacteraceae bacterium]
MAAPDPQTTQPTERRFQQLIESVTDYAIYMLDPQGRVLSWSPAAERIKGYTQGEVEGQHFSRFFTAEDQQSGVPQQILERARTQGSVSSEGWRVRKDGQPFWALATVHAIRGEDGELIGFAKVTRDMTEQRIAQQALLESERRFRLLVEGVVDYAIYMLDVNGVVTNWNTGAERIKGYRADEIIGRHFSTFYTPEDRRAGVPARALDQARTTGKFEAEGWRVKKDGTRFWASVVIDAIYDETGAPMGFAKITRDVSEQRAQREQLEQSERQFRMLVAGVVDYALFMLDPNGIISNWNAGAEHIKGYRAEEIIGQHMSVFYTAPDRAAGLPMRALQTAREQGRYEAEAWRVRKDGTLFWASVVIDAIYEEDGAIAGFAKITRDITERRNAQIEIQKANERLAQAQKMEAMGQLTGGVAHDFNNLLMVVGGQAQLLRKHLPDDARVQRALDAIEMSTRRGQDLTRHLLAFARRQRLNPEPVSLEDRSSAIRELLSATLGSTVNLRVDFPTELWPVEVDPGELELAILNMAVNARDAMPAGGVLTIAARNLTLHGEPDPDLKGDFVGLMVQDTGTGIAPDILARVFEPFFTTKDVDKGTGLGLSQVYGFTQQSGGRATVTSELGVGTTITLYLPRSFKTPGQVEEEPDFEAPRGACILVVEDNPDVADVSGQLLQELGNRAMIVSDPRAALRAIEKHDDIDLVFSDIVMAGDMDGIQLARRIREQRPDMPILLTTGYSQASERLAGEFPILPKPFELADLSKAIAGQLARRAAGGDGKLVELSKARKARAAKDRGQ